MTLFGTLPDLTGKKTMLSGKNIQDKKLWQIYQDKL
jgi:hypothetical protein